MYQTAATYNVFTGYIYIPNDYGSTWTQAGLPDNWQSVSVSSSGMYQTAVIYGGLIYISSDYGKTWTQMEPSRLWSGVCVSFGSF